MDSTRLVSGSCVGKEGSQGTERKFRDAKSDMENKLGLWQVDLVLVTLVIEYVI